MRIRSFILAYSLVLAILLFADHRTKPSAQDHYSHVVDLTDAPPASGGDTGAQSRTHIIAPDSLIPGTWTASQIPPERLIAPLVVLEAKASADKVVQVTLDDIADWEKHNGAIPQGSIVAIRQAGNPSPTNSLPITAEAAQFLMDARYTTGFALDGAPDFGSDRTLARQIALHGNYVVEGASRLASLPPTGSLIIVAPAKTKNLRKSPVRVLAMVR